MLEDKQPDPEENAEQGVLTRIKNGVLREGTRLRMLIRVFGGLFVVRIGLPFASNYDMISTEELSALTALLDRYLELVFVALIALLNPGKADT